MLPYGLPFLSPGSVFESFFVNYLMESKSDDEKATRFADYLVYIIYYIYKWKSSVSTSNISGNFNNLCMRVISFSL